MTNPVQSRTSGELINLARTGLPEEAAAALQELENRASTSDDPQCYADLAEAYVAAQRYDDAIYILRQLVDRDPTDRYRLSLAMAYWQVEQVALCRHHLSHLASHATTEQIREYARVQLEQYETALGLGARDQRFAALQEASLCEQVASAEPTATAFSRLARLMLRQGGLKGAANVYAETVQLLDQGRRRFPDDTAILELLINCYLRDDPEGRLDATIRELERLDPESRVLSLLAGIGEDDSEAWQQRMSARLHSLFRQATEGDDAARSAALEGMRRIVNGAPGNPDYRVAYAFALAANSAHQEALTHAVILSQQSIESHSIHFNLGQIYLFCGHRESARRHFDLALRYATSEEERQDVRDRIDELGLA